MSRKTSDNRDNTYNNDLVAEIEKYYKRGYLAPKFSIYFSVDSLAEKYPGWSPYNYTLLNPVKLIDPDGRSVDMPDNRYKLSNDGRVEYYDSKGGENTDYLIDEAGNEIKINDTSILSQLECRTLQERASFNKDVNLTGHFAVSKNDSEIKKVFEWIASRNSNEWAYLKGNKKNEDFSFIGTLHDNTQAPSPGKIQEVLGDFNLSTYIHSHYGTALFDFRPSISDRITAENQRKQFPNAKFSIFSPLINKENYNKAVDGRLHRDFRTPFKKIDYEPNKYIPY